MARWHETIGESPLTMPKHSFNVSRPVNDAGHLNTVFHRIVQYDIAADWKEAKIRLKVVTKLPDPRALG